MVKYLIITYFNHMSSSLQVCVLSSTFWIMSITVDVYRSDYCVEIFIVTSGLRSSTGFWMQTDSVATFPIYSITSLPYNNCKFSQHAVFTWTLFGPLLEAFGYVFLSCDVYPRTLEWHRHVVFRHWLTKNGGCRDLSYNNFKGTLPMSLSALTSASRMWVPNDNWGVHSLDFWFYDSTHDSMLDHSNVCLPMVQRHVTQPTHGTSGCVARATLESSIFVRKQWQWALVRFHVYMYESTNYFATWRTWL